MGAYTLLQDLTVATNSTSVVLNDFGTITKDDFIKIVTTFTNATSSATNIDMRANGVSNAYTFQLLEGNGSSTVATRASSSGLIITSVEANKTCTDFVMLKLSENDRVNTFSNTNRENDSGVRLLYFYSTSNGATFANGITSLSFNSGTNAIGTGSRIQIYKLAAEKVAEITVASNTTQVDISNLSIDKDSEYLLVSDMVGGNNVHLTVNDDTTLTNYHVQLIIGNTSGFAADRANNARYMSTDSTELNGIAYTHIKLSNIGAYTFQSYNLKHQGTSLPQLLNFFGSSTAENITSITKLNIVSQTTNAIGTGSRFILYKLYE